MFYTMVLDNINYFSRGGLLRRNGDSVRDELEVVFFIWANASRVRSALESCLFSKWESMKMRVLQSFIVVLMVSVMIAMVGNVNAETITDANLLQGKSVSASSDYGAVAGVPAFSPSNATDGTTAQHVFAGTGDLYTDTQFRLVVSGIDSNFNLIRLWRDITEQVRVPAQALIKSSTSATSMLYNHPDWSTDASTTLATVPSITFNEDGYADFAVDVPTGTTNLHFDFGGVDSLGNAWGPRIVEVQAFFRVVPGDANSDGYVDSADSAILAQHWLQASDATWAMGDFNGDEKVNDIDATLLATNWCPQPLASVPEPGVLVLLTGILLAAGLRRRK